ncbi:MAG: PAS domain-containing protein, partial [Pseudomonadota bacterium]
MPDMLESILDTHPDIICRFDDQRVFTYVNQAAAGFFRMERDDLIGSQLRDRVPPDQQTEVDDRLTGLSISDPMSTTLHKVIRDDRVLHILWTNIALYEDGLLTGYQSVGRDVSAETTLRREIREQAKTLNRVQQELRLVLDAVPSRIWYKDDKNTILRLNAAAADSMGRTVADTEGRNTYDLFGDAAKSYHEDDLAVLDSGTPLRGKIEPYTSNEGDPGWVQTDKSPLALDGEADRRILVVATDITELKEKETLLESINRNLDDFASLTSHDLQAPLRKIAISAEL